jgi:hypothetical protein
LLILALLTGGWLSVARAEASAPAESPANSVAGGAPPAPEAPYASYSNDALTGLAAEWDTLDVHERRALLTEVRQRMARSRSPDDAPKIQIRTERRFGRIIRQPDGRVVRIETRIVQVRPATESELAARGDGYGVGFERRARSIPADAEPGHAPDTAPSVPAVAPVSTPPAEAPAEKPFGSSVLKPLPR